MGGGRPEMGIQSLTSTFSGGASVSLRCNTYDLDEFEEVRGAGWAAGGQRMVVQSADFRIFGSSLGLVAPQHARSRSVRASADRRMGGGPGRGDGRERLRFPGGRPPRNPRRDFGLRGSPNPAGSPPPVPPRHSAIEARCASRSEPRATRARTTVRLACEPRRDSPNEPRATRAPNHARLAHHPEDQPWH